MEILAHGFTAWKIVRELFIYAILIIINCNIILYKLKCNNCPKLIYKAFRVGILQILGNEDLN